MSKQWLTDLIAILSCRRVITVGVVSAYLATAHLTLTDYDINAYFSIMSIIVSLCVLYVFFQLKDYMDSKLINAERELHELTADLMVEQATLIAMQQKKIVELIKQIGSCDEP